MSATIRSLRRNPHSRQNRFLPALALPLAMAAMAAAQVRPTLQAADLGQWVAGQRALVTSPTDAERTAIVAGRVSGIEQAIGLGGAANRRFEVVDDRFHHRRLDEVTYLDASARPVGLVRLDADGRLASAVRLGYRDAFALGNLDATGAIGRAAALAHALSMPPPAGSPAVRPAMNGTLWSVSWPRLENGVAVDGDGLTIRLWRSADVHSVTVSERPLDRAPVTISPAVARTVLEGLLPDLLLAERRADASLGPPSLHWVAPNDRFRPEGADGPAASLRLAYVFEMHFRGDTGGLLRAVRFWIDAATGALIGGDVLQ